MNEKNPHEIEYRRQAFMLFEKGKSVRTIWGIFVTELNEVEAGSHNYCRISYPVLLSVYRLGRRLFSSSGRRRDNSRLRCCYNPGYLPIRPKPLRARQGMDAWLSS